MPRPKPPYDVDRLTLRVPSHLFAELRRNSLIRDMSMNQIVIDALQEILGLPRKKTHEKINDTI